MEYTKFGEEMRVLRARRHQTMKDMAEVLGVTLRHLYQKRITNVSKCSTPWQKHEKKPLFKGFSRLDGGAYGTRTRDLLRDREAR